MQPKGILERRRVAAEMAATVQLAQGESPEDEEGEEKEREGEEKEREGAPDSATPSPTPVPVPVALSTLDPSDPSSLLLSDISLTDSDFKLLLSIVCALSAAEIEVRSECNIEE